jgi:hypothetical protein
MAKQTIYATGLLPDGRVLRVVKVDARRMLDISRRVGASFPEDKKPTAADVHAETQRLTLIMCVKGITAQPAEFKTGADGKVDVDATLRPYVNKDAPEFKRIIPLGEMQLDNDDPGNEHSVFNLFEDVGAWRAALDIVAAAGGSFGANPFGAKVLKTSAG